VSSSIGNRRVAVESRNEAGTFPKLYRAPVRKLLSVLECRFIAGGFKIRAASIMTVCPHGVDAKPGHERRPLRCRETGKNTMAVSV
jgi:hypothetical protein